LLRLSVARAKYISVTHRYLWVSTVTVG